MLQEFDALVNKRKQLQSWWKRKTTTTYRSRCHTLRVDILLPTMVAFCGQEYAGANNYHEAPEFFKNCIKKEMEKDINEITERAYNNEIERLNNEIEKYREAVLSELGE